MEVKSYKEYIYMNICTYSMYNNMEEEKRLEEGRRKRKRSKAQKKKELIIAKTLESIYMKKTMYNEDASVRCKKGLHSKYIKNSQNSIK